VSGFVFLFHFYCLSFYSILLLFLFTPFCLISFFTSFLGHLPPYFYLSYLTIWFYFNLVLSVLYIFWSSSLIDLHSLLLLLPLPLHPPSIYSSCHRVMFSRPHPRSDSTFRYEDQFSVARLTLIPSRWKRHISSETSVTIYQAGWCLIPEESNCLTHFCENLRFRPSCSLLMNLCGLPSILERVDRFSRNLLSSLCFGGHPDSAFCFLQSVTTI
jgi:hypothetical protein